MRIKAEIFYDRQGRRPGMETGDQITNKAIENTPLGNKKAASKCGSVEIKRRGTFISRRKAAMIRQGVQIPNNALRNRPESSINIAA
jgi:hypothetical protein